MEVLDRVEKNKLRDLLGKGWLTHDGAWFYTVYAELGIEKANALNLAAIQTMAPLEMKRCLNVLGLDQTDLKTFEDLTEFVFTALELILPESVFVRFSIQAYPGNIIHWEWAKGECFAFKGMTQMDAIHDYRCGVMYRIACWFEALGIAFEMEPRVDKCMMHHQGSCTGNIRIFM